MLPMADPLVESWLQQARGHHKRPVIASSASIEAKRSMDAHLVRIVFSICDILGIVNEEAKYVALECFEKCMSRCGHMISAKTKDTLSPSSSGDASAPIEERLFGQALACIQLATKMVGGCNGNAMDPKRLSKKFPSLT